MKRAPVLLFLGCCLAGGVLAHHFTESPRSGRRAGRNSLTAVSTDASPVSPSMRAEANTRAQALRNGIWPNEPLTRAEILEILDALRPEDYLLAIRAMDDRLHSDAAAAYFLDPDLKAALDERAAEADAPGLLMYAEESFGDDGRHLEAFYAECRSIGGRWNRPGTGRRTAKVPERVQLDD
jgi:hypothetical protein